MGAGGRIAFLGGAAVGADIGGVHASTEFLSNYTINAEETWTSGDLRGANGVPSDAVGIFCVLHAQCDAVHKQISMESADDVPDGKSSRLHSCTTNRETKQCMVRLGTGANAGKVSIKALAGNWIHVAAWVVGWWK